MAEFTLREKQEEDTLKLNIGENSYQIPLATGMTLDEARSVETIDGAIEFFQKYIDPEVSSTLTVRNYRDILTAWQAASREAVKIGDSTLGES